MPYRMKRPTVALAVTIGLLSGMQTSAAGPGDPSPFPSEEEVRAEGFAVWPEDTVEEAREACSEHADDQPWRLSAMETAEHFARTVLSHRDPKADPEFSDVNEHHARVWLVAKEVFLSNIVELRRADVCWFITFGEPRESGPYLEPVFVEEDGNIRAYFEGYTRTSSDFEELGFGNHTKTFEAGERPFRRSWVLPDDALGEEGHAMYLGWDRKAAETVSAQKLPPPPEVGGGQKVFPAGEHFSWREIAPEGRRRGCRLTAWSGKSPKRVLNQVLQWEFDSAMPSGPYPAVMRVGKRGWIGKRVFISQLSEGSWNVKIDAVPYRFVMAQAAENCWTIDKIRPRKKARHVNEVFYDDTAATIDFEFQGAGKLFARMNYGQDGPVAMVHSGVPSRVAFYSYESNDVDNPPGLLLTTLMRKGKYVNAYSRLLPPRRSS